MSKTEPFRITPEHVRSARLEPGDVGKWCLLVDGSYHIFNDEAGAKRAHEMLLAGQMVR